MLYESEMTAATSCTPQKRKSFLANIPADNGNSRIFQEKGLKGGDPLLVPSITPGDINRRAEVLFQGLEITQGKSILARIFATYSIVTESENRLLGTPRRRPTRQNALQQPKMKPILPLLQSVVSFESTSLAGRSQHSRVSFSGIDGSAVQPPVDRVDGSGAHQHGSIMALLRVKQAVDALVEECYENNAVLDAIMHLRDFLSKMTNEGKYTGSCAKSIGAVFSPKRIVYAAKYFGEELTILAERMDRHRRGYKPLMFERRLAELVGQAIRYRLRLLFNGAPPRLSSQDVGYKRRSQKFSQVENLLTMTTKENYSNGAMDDSCISALVSNALSQICEYAGVTSLVDANSGGIRVPDGFCRSSASLAGFRIRGPSVVLSEAELSNILDDIKDACDFLATVNACQFLVSLMTCPGVQDEIDRQGGWSQVETYASISYIHQLWKLCPSDEHLVSLSNVEVMMERLQQKISILLAHGTECERELASMEQRFHTNTRTQNVLRKFPQIAEISLCLTEGLERAYAFPCVQPTG